MSNPTKPVILGQVGHFAAVPCPHCGQSLRRFVSKQTGRPTLSICRHCAGILRYPELAPLAYDDLTGPEQAALDPVIAFIRGQGFGE